MSFFKPHASYSPVLWQFQDTLNEAWKLKAEKISLARTKGWNYTYLKTGNLYNRLILQSGIYATWESDWNSDVLTDHNFVLLCYIDATLFGNPNALCIWKKAALSELISGNEVRLYSYQVHNLRFLWHLSFYLAISGHNIGI